MHSSRPVPVSAISIRRRHSLDHKQAKNAADKVARDLKERFDLDYAWEGDHIAFRRPGLSGSLHVGKNEVSLEAQLSFLLTPLKGPIEQAIHRELDALFKKA
jgi:putative polyhydroxyalkanoate system protein